MAARQRAGGASQPAWTLRLAHTAPLVTGGRDGKGAATRAVKLGMNAGEQKDAWNLPTAYHPHTCPVRAALRWRRAGGGGGGAGWREYQRGAFNITRTPPLMGGCHIWRVTGNAGGWPYAAGVKQARAYAPRHFLAAIIFTLRASRA